MSSFIRAAAHAAAQVVSQQGLTCKRSHLIEIIAALLGYQTYAALTAEDEKAGHQLRMSQAENLILNLPLGSLRARSLQLPLVAVDACVEGIKGAIDAKHQGVYVSISEFWIDVALNILSNHLYKDAKVQSLMEGPDWDHYIVETMFERQHESGPLWSSVNEWKIDAWGELQAEDDDHICLDAFGVIASLEFLKAGRAGVSLARVRLALIPDCGSLESGWLANG